MIVAACVECGAEVELDECSCGEDDCVVDASGLPIALEDVLCGLCNRVERLAATAAWTDI